MRFVFQISQSPKKIILKKLSWVVYWYGREFQAQDSFLEYVIFLEIWRSEKWIELSEKKPPLDADQQRQEGHAQPQLYGVGVEHYLVAFF